MQDIREWLQEVITQLSNANLNSSAKLAAAVVLMCCAHRVCISGIPESMCLTLLTMMVLQPDGAGVVFLGSLMKNENMSRYCMLYSTCKHFNQSLSQQMFKGGGHSYFSDEVFK